MDPVTTPRRRDAARTRARILAAATKVFGDVGYSRAGLREIALEAGVATSLMLRYFGSKAGLFEAALLETIDNNSVFTLEKSSFGPTMAKLMLEEANVSITAMLVLALADAEAKEVAERVSRTRIIAPLAAWLGPPQGFDRALNLYSLMAGFVILAQSLGSEAISPGSLTWLANSLQSIVDAPSADCTEPCGAS
jgi:AcrR family transcriptional regulator